MGDRPRFGADSVRQHYGRHPQTLRQANSRVVPADRIEEVLTKHPTWPWRKAVQSEIKNGISERVTNLVDALQEQLHARTEEMLKKRRQKY